MNVLIVDADADSVAELRGVLSSFNEVHVEAVASGVDARMVLSSFGHGFDVMFLDLALPDLDGIELLARVRQSPRHRNLSVVVCSTVTDRATVAKAASLGVRHYIVKPLTAAVVLAKFAEVTSAKEAKLGGPISRGTDTSRRAQPAFAG